MFTVWRAKGFTSRLQARFSLTKRNVIVESVQATNSLLLNLILQYTNMRMDCLNWPAINIGKEIYHPISCQKDIIKEQYTEQHPRWYEEKLIVIIVQYQLHEKSYQKPPGEKMINTTLKSPNRMASVRCFAPIPSNNDGDILNEIRRRRAIISRI